MGFKNRQQALYCEAVVWIVGWEIPPKGGGRMVIYRKDLREKASMFRSIQFKQMQ
jgi:hypothetical protein